ncbi:hypothetical protein L3X38_004338 [Prunus dulcis]|uniref:Uncharacterized protein n=1 Tax=Prunus dulcis TaxID=3755 RepID=A0AAD4ZNU1_PRUDU|nr:hypothetical protein L3X38_004338 [Prunus dulcis]
MGGRRREIGAGEVPGENRHFPAAGAAADVGGGLGRDAEAEPVLLAPVPTAGAPLDFTPNPPNDSSQNIMMFPKFWPQSDIDWSIKSDNSGSCEVCSKMEWLVYCIVLETGFHSKPRK